MEALLAELRILESKIREYNEKPQRYYQSKIVGQLNKDEIFESVEWNEKYFLITLTFDPKVVINLDEYGQRHRLLLIINELSNYKYYSCLEKHKSGILHAHIMLQSDDIHSIEDILYKNKKHITKSFKLNPAIQIKTVKQTKVDIQRTYDYIFDDKKDHPIYKYIKINI